ncbi:MAG: 4Fe-4S dicluster domain-containing protein [Candidatus Gastranaerophilaceae bacterium]
MLNTLKSRIFQGSQYIKDIKHATINEQFRGFPVLCPKNCDGCEKCLNVCPTGAISLNPLSIDIGKCTFCNECTGVCPSNVIKFSSAYKSASTDRQKLIITGDVTPEEFPKNAIEVRREIVKVFGHSLKLRQVSAGGCNGCETELNACSNVNFDMGRFGIDFVASPKHADGIVITGPITQNMAYALEQCYLSVPDPKIVVLTGACAISGGVFQNSETLDREFLSNVKIDLFIPGCPVHPLTFINAILTFIGK